MPRKKPGFLIYCDADLISLRLNRKGPASKACFKWIADLKDLMKPDSVYVCTGSHEEYEGLCRLLVETGTFTQVHKNFFKLYFSRIHCNQA